MKKQGKSKRLSKLQEQIIFLLGVNYLCNNTKYLISRSRKGEFANVKTIRIPKKDSNEIISMNKTELVKTIRETSFYSSNPTKANPSISRSLKNLEEKGHIKFQEMEIKKEKQKRIIITKKGSKIFWRIFKEVKPFVEIYKRMMDSIREIPLK